MAQRGRNGDQPGRGWKWKAAWGTGIAGVALLAFGVTEQVISSSRYSDFNSHPTALGMGCDADSRIPNYGGEGCGDLLSGGRSARRLALDEDDRFARTYERNRRLDRF